mmetsp:Transcript_11765/g.35713  ORF Transcript_11765/g.35713 Transcript_11765/m.35713 type:complete len:517 (-) Transcript_11765:4705-6255(-)
MTWAGINRGAVEYQVDLYVHYEDENSPRLIGQNVSLDRMSVLEKDRAFLSGGYIPTAVADKGNTLLWRGAQVDQNHTLQRPQSQYQHNHTVVKEHNSGPTEALFRMFNNVTTSTNAVRGLVHGNTDATVYSEKTLMHTCICPIVWEEDSTSSAFGTVSFENQYVYKTLLGGDQGFILSKGTLDKKAYYPGEEIKFSLAVANKTVVDAELTIKFVHRRNLVAYSHKKDTKDEIATVRVGTLDAGSGFGGSHEYPAFEATFAVPMSIAAPSHKGIIASSSWEIVVVAQTGMLLSSANILTATPIIRTPEQAINPPQHVDAYGHRVAETESDGMYSTVECEIFTPTLGIHLVPNYAADTEKPDPRPRIVSVDAGSGGEAAGLLQGDVLLRVNGHALTSIENFSRVMLQVTRRPITVTVLRTYIVPKDKGIIGGFIFGAPRHHTNKNRRSVEKKRPSDGGSAASPSLGERASLKLFGGDSTDAEAAAAMAPPPAEQVNAPEPAPEPVPEAKGVTEAEAEA